MTKVILWVVHQYSVVEIEDFEFDENTSTFSYPCPCGDRFLVTLEDLYDGEEIARCPSCSLIIRVIYNPEDFEREDEGQNTISLANVQISA